MRIVFIGDSITESGKFDDPDKLGNGYVRLVYDYLRTTFPTIDLEIINNGISGNRVNDLAARWRSDVIDLQPDIVSISIGVNDVWRQLDQPSMKQIHPDEFERIYDDLLNQLSKQTEAKIVLMQPTIIEENIDSIGNGKLKAYVEIVNKLAEKYGTFLVPSHLRFLENIEANHGYKFTVDGVHMNSAGNMLMKTGWMEATKAIIE